MNLKENNKEITNVAWNQLYSRLEQDGLLSDNIRQKKTVFHPARLKWVAGVAVLCICMSSVWIIRNSNTRPANMLSLNNEKNAPTLVSTLEDGSIVYLSDYTSLQYPDHFPDNKRQVLLQGDAFFDISKNQERPFVIDTKLVTIEVLGTAFNVKSKKDKSFSLSVKRGKVRVTSKKDGQSVLVNAGETALLQADYLKTVQTADAGLFAKYTKRMHFKDQRLVDVVKVINLNSDSVRLEVLPDIENRLLTVTFSEDTPYTMAQLICISLNLQFTQQQNTILITEPK